MADHMMWVSLVPLALILWGAVSIVQSRREARVAAASQHWPRVAGTVIAAAVKPVAVQGSDPVYDLDLRYRYAVAGQEFEASRLRFGPTPRANGREEIEALARRFPAGSAVQVAYDPGAPQQAVLQPGALQEVEGRRGMGFYLVGLGLVLLPLLQWLAR